MTLLRLGSTWVDFNIHVPWQADGQVEYALLQIGEKFVTPPPFDIAGSDLSAASVSQLPSAQKLLAWIWAKHGALCFQNSCQSQNAMQAAGNLANMPWGFDCCRFAFRSLRALRS